MKKIKIYKWPIIIFTTLILLVVSLTVPLPYYIEVPGGAEDIRHVLKVNHQDDKEHGAYEFVTVGVQRATFAHLVYAWLTDFTDIYSAEEVHPIKNILELINFTWQHHKIWPSIKV